jgi:hypothetical protein
VNKAKFQPKWDLMSLRQLSTVSFHTIHLDFAELKKKSEDVARTQSFLVAVDECTRMCMARACAVTSASVIQFMENIESFGSCKCIITDGAPCFISKELQA